MMDLGATVCLPARPRCGECPVASMCAAHAASRETDFPRRSRKIKRSAESVWLLWIHKSDGSLWLSRRPATGVWAGLYCFPVFDSEAALLESLPTSMQKHVQFLPAFTHVLTHKDLHLHVARAPVEVDAPLPLQGQWVNAGDWPALGLPAPVRKLLNAVEFAVPHQRGPFA